MGTENTAETTCSFWTRLARCRCEGMAATQALRTVEGEARTNELQLLARGLADDLEFGSSLSEAMARRPAVFGEGEVSLVRGGELLGVLDRVLMLMVESAWKRPVVLEEREAEPCPCEEKPSVLKAPSGWHPPAFVDVLLCEMVKGGVATRTLTPETTFAAEAPSGVRAKECVDAPPIDFPHVVNRLKVMADLWPVRYVQPVDGEIEMRISGEGYVVAVRFVDTGECPSCTLSIQAL